MGEFDRLIGVLFDPNPAFADVAQRPRWWVPLVALILIALVITIAFGQRVGWERFMRQQIESSPRTQQLTPEQREQIIEQQLRFVPFFSYGGALLGWPVIVLIVSAAYLFVFNVLLGTQLPFKQVFGVTSYAMLPNAIAGIAALAVMFLKEPADFNLENPLVSNLGAFLDPNSAPRWLVSVGSSIDVFVVWCLLLLATGYAAAARKLAWSKAFTWVVATWVLWLALKGAAIWIFS